MSGDVADERVCPACGQRVAASAEFCNAAGCGTFLDWSDPAAPEVVAPTNTTARTEGAASSAARSVLTAHLSEERVAVDPGQSVSVEVRVRNLGSVVEKFQIVITTAAVAQITSVTPRTLEVYPGEEAGWQLTFAPPRASSLAAGKHSYRVEISSAQGHGTGELEGVLVVGSFCDLVAELVPQKSKGRWWGFTTRVMLENRGNATTRVTMTPQDPERCLRWPSGVAALDLPAGYPAAQEIRGRSKLNWFGAVESFPFAVKVESTELSDAQHRELGQRTLDGVRLQRSLIPRWLPAVTLAVITMAVVALLLLGGAEAARVPSVVGYPTAKAAAAIEKAGLQPRIEKQTSDEVLAGEVIKTDPEASSSLDKGDEVTLFISTGPPPAKETTVPNLLGERANDAESLLGEADLKLGPAMHVTDPDAARGLIVRTQPEANDTVPIGSTVTVYVSTGPPEPALVAVPSLVDEPLEEAKADLGAAGLQVGEVTEESSDGVESGNVIRTVPSADQHVTPGTAVALVVSTGRIAPPPSTSPSATEAASSALVGCRALKQLLTQVHTGQDLIDARADINEIIDRNVDSPTDNDLLILSAGEDVRNVLSADPSNPVYGAGWVDAMSSALSQLYTECVRAGYISR